MKQSIKSTWTRTSGRWTNYCRTIRANVDGLDVILAQYRERAATGYNYSFLLVDSSIVGGCETPLDARDLRSAKAEVEAMDVRFILTGEIA